jgi:hypothetical protein
MLCSCRRVFDALAIALLVFMTAGGMRGAIMGSAALPSVTFSILCLLCAVGLYKGIPKVRTLTGYLLLLSAVGAALVAWRVQEPVVLAVLLCSAFAIVGVGLIVQPRTRRAIGTE